MRRLLPHWIALLVAAWWAVLPINFDTASTVHLFAVIPVLAAWLLALGHARWMRGAALATLVVTTVLVETVLYAHPDVAEAAVVGKAHPVLGEDIAAFVVLAEGATATPESLIEHCKGQLADYKVPRSIEIRDSLPRNATGKILKRELVGS